MHGYPDNTRCGTAWSSDSPTGTRSISYDVRGAGESEKPSLAPAYRLPQLVDDLGHGPNAVSPDAPCTSSRTTGARSSAGRRSPIAAERPDRDLHLDVRAGLDHIGSWMRSALRPGGAGARRVARQLLASSYLVLFNLPRLPEWLWRKGLLDRALAAKSPGDRVPARTLADKINGLQLYRANMARHISRPRPTSTDIPVQVIIPGRDPFVSGALQVGAALPWAADLRARELAGGHWVISTRPDVVARCVAELVEYAETGTEAPTLARARVIAKRPLAGKIAVVLGVGSETAWALAAQGADVIARDDAVPDLVVNHVDGTDDTIDRLRAVGRQMIERGYAGRIVNVGAATTAKRVTTLLRTELGRDVDIKTVCARRPDSPARTARRVVAAIT